MMEDEDVPVFCIYADDDLLWKIFEDWMDEVSSIEFNAGTNEDHYLRLFHKAYTFYFFGILIQDKLLFSPFDQKDYLRTEFVFCTGK